jgi:hypothetical protein
MEQNKAKMRQAIKEEIDACISSERKNTALCATVILQRLSELKNPKPSVSVEAIARESALDPIYHCKSVTGGIALFMKGYNLAKAELQPSENIGQMELVQKIEEVLISHGWASPKDDGVSFGLEIRKSAKEIAALFNDQSNP